MVTMLGGTRSEINEQLVSYVPINLSDEKENGE
jgi:hypothetical protein